MAIKEQKNIIPIPVLGIDTSGPSTLIDSRATPDCQNVRIERTQIKKKEGYSQLGATLSGNVMLTGEFDRQGVKYPFALTTSKFYGWNNPANSFIDYTNGTLRGSVLNPCSYSTAKISGKNILVFTNYADAIQKWEGLGNNIAVLGGTPPIPKYLLGFNRYLMGAYIKDGANIYPERVQWSDYDDPETWTAGAGNNAGSYDLDDGFEITGMFRLGNLCVVPKTDSFWTGYLTGDSRIWQYDSVERRLGFMVGNTIQVLPGGLAIGLSKHGIVQFNGLAAELVVPGIFDDLKDYANPQHIQKAFSVVVAELREYWLFIPITGSDYPTRLYRYNYVTGQVYKDLVTNLTAAGFINQYGRTLIDALTAGIDTYTDVIDDVIVNSFYPAIALGDKDGKVFKFDYSLKNENDVAIDAYWCTADVVPNPGYYTHFQELFYEGLGDTVQIYYSTDEGTTYTLLDTITLTASIATYPIYCDILAEKLRMKVRNAVSGETFTMRNLYYKPPLKREAIER